MNDAQYNYYNANYNQPKEERRGGKIIKFIIILVIIIIIILLLLKFCGVGILTGINMDDPVVIYVDEKEYVQISAIGTGDRNNTKFNFSIGNENIAKLSNEYQVGSEVEAIVKGINPGDTTLTVTANLGSSRQSKSSDLIVCDKLEVSDILDNKITVLKGKVKYLNLDLGKNSKCYDNLKFKFADSSIAARIGNNGIEGLEVGTTELTISDGHGKEVIYDVEVVDGISKVLAKDIKLSTKSLSVCVGKSKTLKATISPSNTTDKSVVWSSNNETIATVKNGRVYGKKVGTTSVQVTTQDGSNKTATTKVKVVKCSGKTPTPTPTPTPEPTTIKVTKITPSSSSVTMYVNETKTVVAGITPTNASNQTITCSSSNTTYFTVSYSGKNCIITGKKAGTGTVTITANDDSGVTATVSVTIKKYTSPITCDVAHCVNCSSNNYCSNCESGYTAVNGKCEMNCNVAHCTKCSSSNYCSNCETNYTPKSGKCEYTGGDSGSCHISNCETYKSTNPCQCKSCQSGYTLMAGADKCCKNISNCKALNADCTCRLCDDGFVSDGKGGCTCNVTHCTVYRSKTSCECQTCSSGHFLVGGGKKCCPLRPNCKKVNTNNCNCTECEDNYVSDGNGGCKAPTVSSKTCVCYKSTYGGKCTKTYGSSGSLTGCLNFCYGSNVCLQHSDGKYYCTETKTVSGSSKGSCYELYGTGWSGTLTKETANVTCGTYSDCTSACNASGMTVKSGSCK